MTVPLLDLGIQNQSLEAELKEAFDRVLASTRYILGPEVEAFEEAIASLSETSHAIGVSSGTDALLLALMALEVGPGDEVICPTYTFFATAGCVARVGATPVFVDSGPVHFNACAEQIQNKITTKTKAIMPVHLFGQMAGMDDIMALAHRHDIAVIEDAAQALGATYKGKYAGSLGDFGTFSFFPSKNLGGFGDAGMLITQDALLAEKAKTLRMHGATPKYYHSYVGGNFRMDPLQAVLLAVKLKHYEKYVAQRQENAAYYTERLKQFEGIVMPNKNVEEGRIILPEAQVSCRHIWNQYTLRICNHATKGNSRDDLKAWLHGHGIGSEIYYPLPLHQQQCFRHLNCDNKAFPIANKLAEECLSIPIYPELSKSQKDCVIDAIKGWLSS